MNPITPFLEAQGYAVLDGGLSTQMELQGADLDNELWSSVVLLNEPDCVRGAHRAFLEAGADIIATATYQASVEGFVRAGLSRSEAGRVMQEAVKIARSERDRVFAQPEPGRLRPLVAASLGPYGACLHDGSEYHGNYDIGRDRLLDFHRERIALLAQAQPDIFAFETVPSLQEAEVIVEAFSEFPGHSAWISFSCRDSHHVAHGEPFAECAGLAAAADGIVAVGVNCTAPANIPGLLDEASGLDVPLAAYPNSGEHWDAARQQWRGEGEGAMDVLDWHRRGARLIGGCCRTVAKDIGAMRDTLRRGFSAGL